jgi:hypothetical protein
MPARILRSGHYYGLTRIAERVGVGIYSLRRKIAKERFPAYHRASIHRNGGTGYDWYTNDMLIAQWEQERIQEAWEMMVRSKTGRTFAYTREPHHADPDMPLHAFTDSDGRWIKP